MRRDKQITRSKQIVIIDKEQKAAALIDAAIPSDSNSGEEGKMRLETTGKGAVCLWNAGSRGNDKLCILYYRL